MKEWIDRVHTILRLQMRIDMPAHFQCYGVAAVIADARRAAMVLYAMCADCPPEGADPGKAGFFVDAKLRGEDADFLFNP